MWISTVRNLAYGTAGAGVTDAAVGAEVTGAAVGADRDGMTARVGRAVQATLMQLLAGILLPQKGSVFIPSHLRAL